MSKQKLHKRIIDKHNKAEKLHKKRNQYPLEEFVKKINLAREINLIIEKESNNDNVIVESRKNLIINSVTAIEVFIKDSIKGKFAYFPKENQQKLLTDKISLWDAYELFRHTKIKTEDIIAGYYSFQNLDTINNIISTLTGKNLLKEIGDFEIELSNSDSQYFNTKRFCLNNKYPDWILDIKTLFKLRNESVHDINTTIKITNEETEDFIDNLVAFVLVLSEFFWKINEENLLKQLDT